MKEPAANYIPVHSDSTARSQSQRVWAIAVSIVFVWIALIVLPAIFAANGSNGFSSPLYGFFSYICHQMPERSFHILEHQFAVCSRCFGVYFGLLVGLLIYPLWRRTENIEPLPRIWLFVSMVPIGIDWSLGMLDIWQNNHASRFITGVILGVGCATYIMPALVEIIRNLSLQKPARGKGV